MSDEQWQTREEYLNQTMQPQADGLTTSMTLDAPKFEMLDNTMKLKQRGDSRNKVPGGNLSSRRNERAMPSSQLS